MIIIMCIVNEEYYMQCILNARVQESVTCIDVEVIDWTD